MRISSDIKARPSEKQLAKMQDLTDMRFGMLVAKEYAGSGKWKCVCDCGNTATVGSWMLRNGGTKSCGCLRHKAKGAPLKYDLTGLKFGRLLVIKHDGSGIWSCECDCGNVTHVKGSKLRSGHTQSCGCLLKERRSESHTKHGGCTDRLYNVHQKMISRCYKQCDSSYKYYGARGIRVCEEWHDYAAFREWAINNGYDENAPRGQCTIDRINTDGDYEPSNCRWTDLTTQSRNRRCVRQVEQLDSDGNVLNVYESGTAAAEATGLNAMNICAACRRRGNHAGYGWRYTDRAKEQA